MPLAFDDSPMLEKSIDRGDLLGDYASCRHSFGAAHWLAQCIKWKTVNHVRFLRWIIIP